MGFPIAPHWPWVNLRLNLSYHRPLLSGFLLLTQTHQNRSPLGCSDFDSHMAMSITSVDGPSMGDKTVAIFFTSTASPRHQWGNCSKPLSLFASTSHWHYHSQLVLNPLNFIVSDITCSKICFLICSPLESHRKGDTVYTVELQQNCFTINGSASSHQVAKAEKSKRPPKKEESAPMVPKTWREQVAAVFPEFLKSSAQARTSSLTIAGLAYTEELQKTLLAHAQLMEKTYSTFKKSVDEKPADKDCEKMKEKMEDQMKTCQKLQALLFISIMSSKKQSMLILLWNGFPNFYDGHSSSPNSRCWDSLHVHPLIRQRQMHSWRARSQRKPRPKPAQRQRSERGWDESFDIWGHRLKSLCVWGTVFGYQHLGSLGHSCIGVLLSCCVKLALRLWDLHLRSVSHVIVTGSGISEKGLRQKPAWHLVFWIKIMIPSKSLIICLSNTLIIWPNVPSTHQPIPHWCQVNRPPRGLARELRPRSRGWVCEYYGTPTKKYLSLGECWHVKREGNPAGENG